MKRILMATVAFFIAAAAPGLTACSPDEPVRPGTETTVPHPNPGPTPDPEPDTGTPASDRLRMTIDSVSFTAALSDNAATKAFIAMLPMTVPMNEMNGNEKYYYLSESLPEAVSNPGRINAGDLMLWGTDCLVLFYDTFPTPYGYTRIGRLENAEGLPDAVGRGNVTVTFEPFR